MAEKKGNEEKHGPIELTCDDGSKVRFWAGGERPPSSSTEKPKKDEQDGKSGAVKGLRFVNLQETTGRKCANCQCSEAGSIKKLLRCARCKVVFYCDIECQKFDWQRIHKGQCKSVSEPEK